MQNASTIQKVAVDKMRQNKLKVTRSRTEILRVLIENNRPLSIEDIESKLRLQINLTTVYRALEQFAARGLVYQTSFRTGKAYFEYQDTHHHHLVCTSCGVQEKVSACVPTKIKLGKGSAFKDIRAHTLEFFGICKKCAD